MANGGYAARNTFRKHLSEKTIKSPYLAVVKTREELDAEEQEDKDFEDVQDESVEEELVQKKSIPLAEN
jgi:hypothetical protein